LSGGEEEELGVAKIRFWTKKFTIWSKTKTFQERGRNGIPQKDIVRMTPDDKRDRQKGEVTKIERGKAQEIKATGWNVSVKGIEGVKAH